MPRQVISLVVENIRLFTESGKGRGRDTNDATNKVREECLRQLLTPKIQDFLTDSVYGGEWCALRAAWTDALADLAVKTGNEGNKSMLVVVRGGRKYNWDIDVVYAFAGEHKVIVKVEFKFGGTSVTSIPEFFNPAANKPFHSVLYASFFYDNYMDDLCKIYDIPLTDKPTKDLYLKHVYKNEPCAAVPFFRTLRDAEDAETTEGRPKYKQKGDLSHKSIQAYLKDYSATMNLAAITSEFQRSQAGKHFLIYSGGRFHHDRIEDDELVAESVAGVEGDVLVIQSKKTTTQHRMLLRWKNHHCVLFPAWQISMIREVVAEKIELSADPTDQSTPKVI